MKYFKKITAVACIAAMLVCCFSFSASALVFEEGDFGYEINTYTKEMTLVKYTGSDSTVTIPGTYDVYPVTKLAKSALSGNTQLQVLNIPTTMYKIDSGALSDCTSLSAIRFPAYITSIGKEVCLNCTSLQTAYVYASIDKLPAYSFTGCRELTNVDLNNSITEIGTYAFQDCSSLTNIGFLSQITSIGRCAFDGTGISSLYVPEGLTVIPDYAFSNCADLEYAEIPGSVTSISETAFYNDPKLILGVYKDTPGHQYAVNNMIDHIVLDGAKYGDVNGDGTVDILDSTEIQKFAAEKTDFTDEQFEMADVNKDDFADVMDALLIQKYAIGKYDIPPIIIRY